MTVAVPKSRVFLGSRVWGSLSALILRVEERTGGTSLLQLAIKTRKKMKKQLKNLLIMYLSPVGNFGNGLYYNQRKEKSKINKKLHWLQKFGRKRKAPVFPNYIS